MGKQGLVIGVTRAKPWSISCINNGVSSNWEEHRILKFCFQLKLILTCLIKQLNENHLEAPSSR